MNSEILFQAIAAGDVDGVEMLLKAEPGLARASNSAGITAVLWAAYHGQDQVVERLTGTIGIELNIFEAAAVGDLVRLRSVLAADMCLAEAFSPDGFSTLGLAAFFGHAKALPFLLACGADPNAASRNGMRVTPLHSAVAHREADASNQMARTLLQFGAYPNVQQQGGWTPLHAAAAHGRQELVELLLKHGADPNIRSDDGQTADAKATEAGHLEIAGLLQKQLVTRPEA